MFKNNGIYQIYFNLSAFLIIIGIGYAFGYWFSINQLKILSSSSLESIADYPSQAFLVTNLNCCLTIIAFFGFSNVILLQLSRRKLMSLHTAISYLPLLLVFVNYSLYSIILLIFSLQLFMLLAVLCKEDYRWVRNTFGIDSMVCILIFCIHIIFTSGFSPLNLDVTWHTSTGAEEIPIVASLFKGYVHAKQFIFSTVDYSAWSSVLNPPITLRSPFLELLTFILDLPSISIEVFHQLLSAIQFILIVSGSFGFYLFLKYGLKLRSFIAFVGSALLFFSPFFEVMMVEDGGIFLSSYVVFPFALLFITLALEKMNVTFASLAGLALASQLFWMAPHPEGMIYTVLFYSMYVSVLLCSCQFNYLIFLKKAWLISVSFFVFLMLSTFTWLPVFYDQFNGNMHVYAHMQDFKAVPFAEIKAYIFLALIFTTIYIWLARRQSDTIYRYLAPVSLTFFLTVFLLYTTQATLIEFMVTHLHMGINVSHSWRIGIFYSMSVMMVAMICFEMIADLLRDKVWYGK